MEPSDLLLSHAIDNFLIYMKYRKSAATTTLSTYKYVLREFLSITGNLHVAELTKKHVDDYALNMGIRGYKPKTFRNKMVVVKCLVSYLYREEVTLIKPEQIELPKEGHTEANFLDEREVTLLLKVVTNVRDRALILTLLRSGVRVSEVTNLRITDIYKRSVAVRNGKGGKPRVTFITPDAEKAINDYLSLTKRKTGYLFANPAGDRLSRVIVARKVSTYAQKAKLDKKVTTHTLRHTFATTMLKRGARVEDVQQILGHANIKTTLIYLHFTAYDLQRSYNKVMVRKQ